MMEGEEIACSLDIPNIAAFVGLVEKTLDYYYGNDKYDNEIRVRNCKVCKTRAALISLSPCGHTVMCRECAPYHVDEERIKIRCPNCHHEDRLKFCPICRDSYIMWYA